MKKAGLVFILVALMINDGWAQKDPKALEVLEAMSAKYQNIEAFKAKLVYKLENNAESCTRLSKEKSRSWVKNTG